MKKNLIRFDWAIKRLLRNKANFGILEGFLSELLEEDIKIENILESESNKETARNKFNRVDLLVKNTTGEFFIIEVQNDYQPDYLLRMLFGTAKLIVDHMDEGMTYGNVRKVVSIHIVYFDLGIGEDYVYYGSTNFRGRRKNDMLTLSAQEKELFLTDQVSKIHPQYYIIKVNDFDDVSKDTLDEWINFLKTQEIKDGTMAKGLKEANEKLKYLHLSEEEKREYDSYIENWRDNESIITGNFEKGKYEGKIEGKIEGIKIGEANKVLEIAKKVTEIAKNCLSSGMSIDVIAKITGISEAEIKNMKL